MTTVYKIISTRPSLDDNFWFEPTEEFCILSTTAVIYNIFDHYPGFVGYKVAPAITWDEIIARKNQLRPDLRGDLDQCSNIAVGSVPLYNPFELVSITEFEFETFDHFDTAYSDRFSDQLYVERFIFLHNKTNNIMKEEVLSNGVKIDYKTKF